MLNNTFYVYQTLWTMISPSKEEEYEKTLCGEENTSYPLEMRKNPCFVLLNSN